MYNYESMIKYKNILLCSLFIVSGLLVYIAFLHKTSNKINKNINSLCINVIKRKVISKSNLDIKNLNFSLDANKSNNLNYISLNSEEATYGCKTIYNLASVLIKTKKIEIKTKKVNNNINNDIIKVNKSIQILKQFKADNLIINITNIAKSSFFSKAKLFYLNSKQDKNTNYHLTRLKRLWLPTTISFFNISTILLIITYLRIKKDDNYAKNERITTNNYGSTLMNDNSEISQVENNQDGISLDNSSIELDDVHTEQDDVHTEQDDVHTEQDIIETDKVDNYVDKADTIQKTKSISVNKERGPARDENNGIIGAFADWWNNVTKTRNKNSQNREVSKLKMQRSGIFDSGDNVEHVKIILNNNNHQWNRLDYKNIRVRGRGIAPYFINTEKSEEVDGGIVSSNAQYESTNVQIDEFESLIETAVKDCI